MNITTYVCIEGKKKKKKFGPHLYPQQFAVHHDTD